MARKKQDSKELQDITEIGENVEGLEELNITEVESDIEAGDKKELVEEKEKECDTTEQLQQKEQSLDKKREVSKNESQKNEQNNDSENLSENETLSEKKPDEEDIVKKIREEELSINSKMKSQKDVKKSGPKSVKPTPAKRGKSVAAPKPRKTDPTVRSTMGLFFRS